MDISLFKKSLGYVETTRPIAISFHELAALLVNCQLIETFKEFLVYLC